MSRERVKEHVTNLREVLREMLTAKESTHTTVTYEKSMGQFAPPESVPVVHQSRDVLLGRALQLAAAIEQELAE